MVTTAHQYSEQYLRTGRPTQADADAMIDFYVVMHGHRPSAKAIAKIQAKVR
jgi:hypothetical protein